MLDFASRDAKNFAPGIGRAVADRTIARLIEKPYESTIFKTVELPRDDTQALDEVVETYCRNEGFSYTGYHVDKGDDLTVRVTIYIKGKLEREDWFDVCERVALGNTSLNPSDFNQEFPLLRAHMRNGTILMSGRHLQHGDENQKNRVQEVFTNCSTSCASFISFYLLLNGSGVGSDYSDESVIVDLGEMPIVVPVISMMHDDVTKGIASGYMTPEEAAHLYPDRNVIVFEVPDSREGWAEAFAQIEVMAWQKRRDDVLVLDFSKVRPLGSPIGGMQDRPASGPAPLMSAIRNIASLREAKMAPWRAKLYADHYVAEVVLVGGARRAARMSTKYWRDPGIFDFIRIKNGGKFLWSSNNSVLVDAEFWDLVEEAKVAKEKEVNPAREEALHAFWVYNAVIDAAYDEQTGEPGFVNVDKLNSRIEKGEKIPARHVLNSQRLNFTSDVENMMDALIQAGIDSKFHMIVNPCGEIQLVKWGGYCVIADVAPYHGGSLEEIEDAFRTTTRALIRTNLMPCLYSGEVKRTNRIGVGITGLHEFALKFFEYGWKDLIDEEVSKDFWLTLARFSQAVKQEAQKYSEKLGVQIPHTNTTMKPAGTTSKLFALTEGAHLPSMQEYLRWVQFRNDDPLVEEYRQKGYPIKRLKTYDGTTVVGFPTVPEIVRLAKDMGLESKLVTASEATPEEQFKYLRLLEKYWIAGNLSFDDGNQVSYTLKYNPEKITKDEFYNIIVENQKTVKCVSVMPQIDTTAYEYQPEQPLNKAEFERVAAAIKGTAIEESVDFEHLACEGGACPIDFSKEGV